MNTKEIEILSNNILKRIDMLLDYDASGLFFDENNNSKDVINIISSMITEENKNINVDEFNKIKTFMIENIKETIEKFNYDIKKYQNSEKNELLKKMVIDNAETEIKEYLKLKEWIKNINLKDLNL